jgi:hypothetical protein
MNFLKQLPFDKSAFKKATLITVVLWFVFHIAMYLVYDEVTNVDLIGSTICAPLLAYFIHMLIIIFKEGEE